jgi:hypothetical protein
MSIAAENLSLPRRDVSRKKLPRHCRTAMVSKKTLPRRCRDGFQKNLSNLTVETILGQKY